MPSPDTSKPKLLTLSIRGCGNPNAFKNRKRIVSPKNGRRPMLITDPDVKRKMEAMSRVLESGLRSAFQTDTAETQTDVPLPSWMHCRVPADDCWTIVPELVIVSELVPLGEEGADITIERL